MQLYPPLATVIRAFVGIHPKNVEGISGRLGLIAATTETFPDGTPFEGVGIVPDYLTIPTAEDLRIGNDPVLQKALQIAATRN